MISTIDLATVTTIKTAPSGKSMVVSLRDFINIYQAQVAIVSNPENSEEIRHSALFQAQAIEISIEEELMSIQREIRSAFLDASRTLIQARRS